MCTDDTLLGKGRLQLGLSDSTFAYHKENWGKGERVMW